MSTAIRSELSSRNKYHISKHRYYELKHFCLQYNDLLNERRQIDYDLDSTTGLKSAHKQMTLSSSVENKVVKLCDLDSKINMIRDTAIEADPDLYNYIMKGVTEERPYEYLQTVLDIPCCRDTYYDRYRKFFYILSQKR